MLGGSQMTIAHSAVSFPSIINIEEVLKLQQSLKATSQQVEWAE
jgi:hypothetical protein